MSFDLVAKVMKTKVGNPYKKLVFIKLADNASDLGECWPSYQHIADQCEMSKRSVMRYIAELEESGFLRKEARKGPKGNSSNVYYLNVEKLNQPSERQSPPSDGESLPSDTQTLPPSDTQSPRIYNSLEPTNEALEKRREAREEATPEQLNNLFSPQTPEPQSRFRIPLNWRPDRDKLEPYCMNAGCPTTSRPDQLIDGIIGDWVNYWHGDGTNKTEAQWFALLAGWLKRKLAEHDSGRMRGGDKSKHRRTIDEIVTDPTTDYAEGLKRCEDGSYEITDEFLFGRG